MRPWVDADSGSVCAHQGSLAFNLCRRVLSVLMCLQAHAVELVPEPTSQVRRRAERKEESIGLVPKSWPIPLLEQRPEDEAASPVPELSTEEKRRSVRSRRHITP